MGRSMPGFHHPGRAPIRRPEKTNTCSTELHAAIGIGSGSRKATVHGDVYKYGRLVSASPVKRASRRADNPRVPTPTAGSPGG